MPPPPLLEGDLQALRHCRKVCAGPEGEKEASQSHLRCRSRRVRKGFGVNLVNPNLGVIRFPPHSQSQQLIPLLLLRGPLRFLLELGIQDSNRQMQEGFFAKGWMKTPKVDSQERISQNLSTVSSNDICFSNILRCRISSEDPSFPSSCRVPPKTLSPFPQTLRLLRRVPFVVG